MPACPDVDINNIITLVKGLKNEAETVAMKCAKLERAIQHLTSRCDTHERHLERYRLEIIGLKQAQGMLETSFSGEDYEIET